MFYHDHAHGITRLNVYAGEAAGYLVTDPQEQDMINGTDTAGINPALCKSSSRISGFPWSSRTRHGWMQIPSQPRTRRGTGERIPEHPAPVTCGIPMST